MTEVDTTFPPGTTVGDILEAGKDWKLRTRVTVNERIDDLIETLSKIKKCVSSKEEAPSGVLIDRMTIQSVELRDELQELRNWHSLDSMVNYHAREALKKSDVQQ